MTDTISTRERTPPDLPIACGLDDLALARRSEAVRRDLFVGVEERIELPAGYAFRFSGSADWPERIGAFVATERTCCSYFRIGVTYEPGLGPIWLQLTGADGVKDFIAVTFGMRP
jgi:hypothetical protein